MPLDEKRNILFPFLLKKRKLYILSIRGNLALLIVLLRCYPDIAKTVVAP